MSVSLYDWRACTGLKTIQNPNYFVDRYIDLINQANADNYNNYSGSIGGGFIPGYVAKQGNIRIPIQNPYQLQAGFYKSPNPRITYTHNSFFGYNPYYQESPNYYWGNGSVCMDYMPRLYVKLTPLSEYLEKVRAANSTNPLLWVYTGTGTYIPRTSGVSWGFSYNEPVSYSAFIEQAGNYFVCEQLSFYTDNNDGSQQTLLDSAHIAVNATDYGYNCKIDVAQPLTGRQETGFPDTDILVGYYSNFMTYKAWWDSGDCYLPTPAMNHTGLLFAAFTGAGTLSPLFNPGTAIPQAYRGWASTPSRPYGGVQYATKSTWEKLLNGGGCAWSYDLNVVTSPDGSGLKRPTTPGQPENPVDTGDGDGDNISDTIEYPQPEYIPNAYRRYWLTSPQIESLKNFLFKGTFLDNVKRLWTEPGEYIVDLSYYPLNPQLLGFTGDSENISIGDISSGINAPILPNNSRLTIYAGSADITRYYNSYLDFEPYTSIDIFLPYIGVRGLNTSQIMGHKLLCAYYLDVNTLQITAALGLDGDMNMTGGSLGNVLTQYTSSFGIRFPLSGTAANQMILNVVQQVAGVVSGSAALIGGVATGNIAMAAGGAATGAGALLSGGQTSPITYGSISPMSGLYAPQLPYLIINRPISAEPSSWAADMGYSAGYSGKVSEFSGALTAQHVDLVRADEMSDDEANAIISALEGGIII